VDDFCEGCEEGRGNALRTGDGRQEDGRREDSLSLEDKIQKGASKMRLVLALGAADASEGTVYVAEDTLCPAEIDRKPCCGKKEEVEYNIYAEKQPGEGFWSVAPGCGDFCEGMVWVAVIRKNR